MRSVRPDGGRGGVALGVGLPGAGRRGEGEAGVTLGSRAGVVVDVGEG